jgi:serine/threonine-protein kinase
MAEIDWAALRQENIGDFTLTALPPTLKLPALPHAVTQFVQKSNDPKVDVRELSAIIETDTGLTVELLRYVNSAFVGLRTKVKTVHQALSLLGQRQSKMFIITTGMQASVRAKQSKLINQSCFWNASLQKALFAKEVAALLKTDGDVAFAGALLQDYLLPVVTNDMFDAYVKFIESRREQPPNICQYEHSNFGWDHALAAACLATRWQLPDELVCCILFHHQGLKILTHPQLGRSPAAAVALSALLPDQLRQSFQGLEHLQFLEKKWPAFNLENIARAVDEKHEEVGMGVRNDFPLLRRCKPAIDGGLNNYSDGSLNTQAAPALAACS